MANMFGPGFESLQLHHQQGNHIGFPFFFLKNQSFLFENQVVMSKRGNHKKGSIPVSRPGQAALEHIWHLKQLV